MSLLPATSTRSTLTRQWELLKLLPAKAPGASAAQLLKSLSDAGYKTTKRTVERDLVELSRLFPLQCNDKGMPFGWYWTPGKGAELPGISLGEALTLRLVEDSLRPLMPTFMLKTLEPRFNLARQKLEAMGEENASARWLDKVASVQPNLSRLPPEIDSGLLETVQQALLDDRQLTGRYYAAHKNQTRTHTLNPLGLVQRAHTTYLIATVEPFADIRQFALHRFEEAALLHSACRKPEGFVLQRYIAEGAMQFGTQEQIHLQAWVSEGLARLISEMPIAADMQLIPEPGGACLSATVNDSWELKWWILSHAGSIAIREPLALKLEIRQRLEQGLSMHP